MEPAVQVCDKLLVICTVTCLVCNVYALSLAYPASCGFEVCRVILWTLSVCPLPSLRALNKIDPYLRFYQN